MTKETWIFAYGSLLWSPGFQPAETIQARLRGYHRSFCMWSIHYRGTAAEPGLVLALDAGEGAFCDGLALRPHARDVPDVIEALRQRELISSAYEERVLPIDLIDGRCVEAVAYVIRREHPQHACLCAEEQARIIAKASGLRGPNLDYLANTAAHLRGLGIDDLEIEALLRRVQALAP